MDHDAVIPPHRRKQSQKYMFSSSVSSDDMNQTTLLIMRVREGDVEAFHELYELFKRRAWKFALIYARDKSIAASIVQDAFVEVYKNIRQLRSPEAFQTWFYRILYTKSLRYIKQDAKRKADLVYFDEDFDLVDQGQDPVNEVIRREYNLILWKAVAHLPYELRIPLVLRYVEGLSDTKIARVLGISIGTVKWRIRRGRRVLSDIINKTWGGNDGRNG